MTKEQKDTLRYYDEIFIKDSVDKRIEDYCNKKHLYRLYRNKPVVMKEIKISLKEFAEQETKELETQIKELEAQIEKMKCCCNCMWSDCDGKLVNPPCKYCDFNNNKWELRR